MSAPAAKARAEPVRRIAAMVGEAAKVLRAWFSSVMRGVERALRALGRERVTGSLLVGGLWDWELGIWEKVVTLPNSRSWFTGLDKLVGPCC